ALAVARDREETPLVAAAVKDLEGYVDACLAAPVPARRETRGDQVTAEALEPRLVGFADEAVGQADDLLAHCSFTVLPACGTPCAAAAPRPSPAAARAAGSSRTGCGTRDTRPRPSS